MQSNFRNLGRLQMCFLVVPMTCPDIPMSLYAINASSEYCGSRRDKMSLESWQWHKSANCRCFLERVRGSTKRLWRPKLWWIVSWTVACGRTSHTVVWYQVCCEMSLVGAKADFGVNGHQGAGGGRGETDSRRVLSISKKQTKLGKVFLCFPYFFASRIKSASCEYEVSREMRATRCDYVIAFFHVFPAF